MRTAGIDIAKASLAAALADDDGGFEASNDASGWAALARWLRARGADRVGLEASGGYERGALAHLADAGFEVHLLDPAGARHFARAMGVRAKNDRIDARMIARYAAHQADAPRPRDPRLVKLKEHLRFLEQIEADRARWKTRAETFHTASLKAMALTRARRADHEARRRLQRLETALRRHGDLARRLDLALSIPGVGPRTAIAMIILVPELGSLSREQAAALLGVAPWDRDSGAFAGQRRIANGRDRARKTLYNAAGMARRWNPELETLYTRLTARGKHHKCALIACVRKLAIYINAVLARKTPWTQTQNQQ